MLTHCDFVYAGESAKFQMPFINLGAGAGVRIELLGSGADRTPPCGELILLGLPFDARRGRRSSDL